MKKLEKGINYKVTKEKHKAIKNICTDEEITLQEYFDELVNQDLKKRNIALNEEE